MSDVSMTKYTVERILEAASDNSRSEFSDQQIADWLGLPVGSDELRLAWLNVYTTLKDQHDIWLLRIRNTGYKVASDKERLTTIFQQKQRRIIYALTDQTRCLAGVSRSELDDDDKRLLDSSVTKAAFGLVAITTIARAREPLDQSVVGRLLSPPKFRELVEKMGGEENDAENQ